MDLHYQTAKLVLVHVTSPAFLDINVFPPSFALVTHLFSVIFAMLHRYTRSYSTKTDAPYGAPPHLKMKPHLTEKQTLPIEK